MEIMNKIGNQMTIEDGYRRTFRVESSPVRTGQVYKVLQQFALFRRFGAFVVHTKKLKMRGTGKGFRDIGLIGVNALEPDKILVRTEPYFRRLIGDETIDSAVNSKESAPMIDLDNPESALGTVGCSGYFTGGLLYGFDFLVL
jgi:hypothetical protein